MTYMYVSSFQPSTVFGYCLHSGFFTQLSSDRVLVILSLVAGSGTREAEWSLFFCYCILYMYVQRSVFFRPPPNGGRVE